MTIDERLEALTARHEALAMNLELLVHDTRQDREKVRVLHGSVEKLVGVVENLVQVVTSHERRLTDLEGPHPR